MHSLRRRGPDRRKKQSLGVPVSLRSNVSCCSASDVIHDKAARMIREIFAFQFD